MNSYKDEAGKLHSDIDSLLNNLMDKNEDVLKAIQPDLIEDYRLLKSQIGE